MGDANDARAASDRQVPRDVRRRQSDVIRRRDRGRARVASVHRGRRARRLRAVGRDGPRSDGPRGRIGAATAMNPLVSIVRNWSLLACAQVASSAIALVFMVFISRRLGDVEFGRLFLALTLTTLVGVAVDLGLSQVMIRAIAREHGLARPYLRRAALVVAAAGTSLYLLLLGAIKVLGFTAEVQSLVGILGLLMIAEGFSQILGAVFQARERMLIPALTRLAGNAFSLVVVVPLIQLGQGATAVASVLVLAAALRVLFQLIQLRRLDGLRMSGQR